MKLLYIKDLKLFNCDNQKMFKIMVFWEIL